MKLSAVAFFLLACLTSQVSAESDVLDKVQLLLNGDRERELKGFNIPKPTPAEAPHPAPTPKAPTYITGDPHIKKFDGTSYDFHGGCDLVLVSNPQFNNGQGLHIHVRTKITHWWSSIDRAVVRIGDDTFEVKSGLEDKSYWINGQHGHVKDSGVLPFEVGGFLARFRHKSDSTIQYKIVLDDDSAIIIRSVKTMLRVELVKSKEEHFGTSLGLMGSFDTGELLGRDGVTVFEDPNAFGQEWQVKDTDPQLFLESEGPQYPQECDMPAVPMPDYGSVERRQLRASTVSHKAAQKACSHVDKSDFKNCVFDVMAMDDLSAAEGY